MEKCPKCGSTSYKIEIVSDSAYIVCPCGTIRSKTSI